LPAEVRKAMGLKPGDTLVVSLEEGRLVLEPAVVLPIELYTEERVEEFARAAEMSAEEMARARRRWGV
jgi:antitoxin PrlF